MRCDVILTGLPRSGTSYLCKLIHQNPNWIAINEPKQLLHCLNQKPLPLSVDTLYRQLRDDINRGQFIKNKLHCGQLIEDTFAIDIKPEFYQPEVNRTDFMLVIKNTLGYILRLQQLRSVLPDTKILACVRDPFDTIASWKTSFPHLNSVDVERLFVGGLNDVMLNDWQRKQMSKIATLTSLPQRRALFWTYLCKNILQYDDICLLAYEQIIQDPRNTLEKIEADVENCPPLLDDLHPLPSRPVNKRKILNKEDIAAIHHYCTEVAQQLGYNLDEVSGQ